MWTAETLDWKSNLVNFSALVRFTDGKIEDIISLQCTDEVDKNAQIVARLNLLDKHEAAKTFGITKGMFVATLVKPQDPPTQDEIDQVAFLILVDNYRVTQAQIKAGVGKVQQSDLDAITSDIKNTYKDTYASFLVGLF